MLQESTVMELMHQGGWVMWALLALSVTSLAVAVERSMVLYRHRVDAGKLLDEVRSRLAQSDSVRSALSHCESTRGPLASVVKAGLLHLHGKSEELEQAVEAAARFEIRRLERRLAVLATTATVAPLLGFFGTVTGMMAAFGALVEYGMSDPTLVAAGIEEALTTTAAGLGVAIPVQLVYNVLHSRIGALIGDMELAADILCELCRNPG